MGTTASNASPHRAAARVVDILETVAAAQEGLSLKDLSVCLDAPKSSLLPLLRTLAARGYLDTSAAGAYRLGQKVIELGASAPGRSELPEASRPALMRLSARTGEPSFIGTMISDRSGVVYIDRVESRQTIRFSVELGEKRSWYATAVGKAILAYLPEEEREDILRSLKFVRYTPRTVTGRAALRDMLAEVRRSGVSVNIEEAMPGAAAIAAPIFDRANRVVAACAVGAPVSRARPNLRKLIAEVQSAAREISRMLGHRPAPGART